MEPSNLAPEQQLRRLLLQEEQERLDQLEARIGTDDALKRSLTPIIADVLSEAGKRDHRRLAGAIAPLIVRSIKAEIRNSRDMMVDALYPLTWRLVAAAVRNAFKELLNQLNEKLDTGLSWQRWRPWVKAWLTGVSQSEILLSEGAAFEIADLLVINRRTGLLIAQVSPDTSNGVDGQLLSSVLTATMAFVRDAMRDAQEQDLRTIDVGIQLHIQVSASVILAVKTRGPQPAGFETALSEAFCAILAVWGGRLPDIGALPCEELSELSEDLRGRLAALVAAQRRSFRRPSRKGTALILLLVLFLCGWLGSSAYQSWRQHRTEAQAEAVIAAEAALVGYPLHVTHDHASGAITIDGLAPDRTSVTRLRKAMSASLPTTKVDLRVRSLEEAIFALKGTAGTRPLPVNEDVVYQLEPWLDRQAVRFGDDASFADPAATNLLLRQIALKFEDSPPSARLRVVGYADETGSRDVDQRLSEERAAAVQQRLFDLGVKPHRVIAVGRAGDGRLSPATGTSSSKPGVEFELVVDDGGADGAR